MGWVAPNGDGRGGTYCRSRYNVYFTRAFAFEVVIVELHVRWFFLPFEPAPPTKPTLHAIRES